MKLSLFNIVNTRPFFNIYYWGNFSLPYMQFITVHFLLVKLYFQSKKCIANKLGMNNELFTVVTLSVLFIFCYGDIFLVPTAFLLNIALSVSSMLNN